MTMQTVSLSTLEPGRGNPRKAMNRNGLEGLAASIRNDGLLQNLVVKPVKGKGEHYRIVSGERRFRALKLLQERGEVDGDYAVPVEIRVSLSKDDSLRIATVENLQRQNLAPLEETAALTKLIHGGTTLDDVAARTGLSQTTIKRRLALNKFAEGHLYSYDLAECGRRALDVERLATHWLRVLPVKMLVIDYEELIEDPEGESRRLIEFLGLDWEPACLDFYRTQRPVFTASSWQVRQPLFKRSVGR